MSEATITFRVHAIPKPQPRPRATIRGKHAAVYNPSDADDWKGSVARAAMKHRPDEPIAYPVYLTIEFVLPRPRGHYGTGRNAGILKPSAPFWCATKPDLDNLEKSVMDALTDIGMWDDDSLVVEKETSKCYAANAQCVGATITIERAVA